MRRASTTKKHCRIRCDLLPMPCRPGVVPLILVLVLSSQVCHVVNAWMLHPNVHKSLALTSQSHLQSYAKDSVRNNDVLARLRTRKPLTPLHSSIKYEAVARNSTDEHLETMNRSFPSEYEVYQNQKLDLQLILLDNYDSYTYNIYSYLSTMCKKPPIVVSNDAYDSWKDLIQDVGAVDGIVISPGPGRPERKEDMGICLEVSNWLTLVAFCVSWKHFIYNQMLTKLGMMVGYWRESWSPDIGDMPRASSTGIPLWCWSKVGTIWTGAWAE